MWSILKRKYRSALWRANYAAKPVVRTLRYRRIVERMHLGVCTPCQYDCVSCSHQAARYLHKNYQMSIEEVTSFIRFTEESKYFIDKLHLTGPGEPLLWKHLTDGLRLLRASPNIREIEILSNGVDIDRVKDSTWQHFDRLVVSLYPETAHLEERLRARQREHPGKLSIRPCREFAPLPAPDATAAIPCECQCSGPMFFNNRVYFFCGPPVFGAAQAKGVSVDEYPEISRELGSDYLETTRARDRFPRLTATIDPIHKAANHELCRYCFANSNIERISHPHVAFIRLSRGS